MALDGVTLAYLIYELAPLLCGAHIDKISQPEKDEIHFLLRLQQGSKRLLLSTGATSARFHLTQESKKNPPSPPMFCMILRKHLEGGKIVSLQQRELERVVTFEIQNYNDRRDLVTLHLHLEIMGKHSNLILADPANTILDGLKRYSHATSRYREVLPGRTYLAPPSQGKQPPLENEEQWRQTLLTENLDHSITKLLLARFAGISPELAREIVIQAGLDTEILLHQCGDIDFSRLFQAYRRLCNPRKVSEIRPCLYYPHNPRSAPLAFSFVPFQQYQELRKTEVPTLNEAIESFYQAKSSNNTLESKRGSLRKIVREQRAHFIKKLKLYDEAISSASSNLAYQRWGELLTANLYRIPPEAAEVTVEDYYDPSLSAVVIPLDPHISAIDNAQRYYKLYNKAKATLLKTKPLKEAAFEEVNYLDSLLVSLDQVSALSELDEIHAELISQGYLAGGHSKKDNAKLKKGRHNTKSKTKVKTPKEVVRPRVYRSSQGRTILVGKNNVQNDWLSLHKGKPNDLWLHVKQIPGSHVLVPLEDGEEFPDDATLEEAAALAIYFSQSRGSSQVAVDYTHVRQLKKPNSAKPGMVIYEQNWTLYLTPKAEILERLLASEDLL